RIAAQAVRALARLGAMGDELADDVDVAIDHAVEGVRVVRRNVVLRRIGRPEPLPGEEEELVDLDVWRQRAGVDGGRVIERRIAGEHASRERIEKAPLQLLLGTRSL